MIWLNQDFYELYKKTLNKEPSLSEVSEFNTYEDYHVNNYDARPTEKLTLSFIKLNFGGHRDGSSNTDSRKGKSRKG